MSKAGASTSRRIASSTQHEDAFGNITHVFTAEGPLSELRVVVDGEVDTQDTSGVVTGAIERFPPSLYLRETPLTLLNPAIAEFAAISRRAGEEPLAILHDLLERLHDDMIFDNTPTADDHHRGRGVRAQAGCVPGPDPHLHRRCAKPRHSGALHRRPLPPRRWRDRAGGRPRLGRSFRPGLGWIAFDTANGLCATDAHVRVAVGLDYLGAAPVRGSRYGGGGEALDVAVRVNQVGGQTQSQS